MRVDLDGIVRRIAAFPVPEGRYGQIAGVASDKVVWTLMPIAGAHGRGGHKDSPGRLEVFDFETMKCDTLVDRVDEFVVAADRATLVLRDGRKLRAVRADRAPDPRERAVAPSEEPSRKIRLHRPRSGPPVGRPAQRMEADAARSVAAAARPVLGAGHVRRRLGRTCTSAMRRCFRELRRAASSPT